MSRLSSRREESQSQYDYLKIVDTVENSLRKSLKDWKLADSGVFTEAVGEANQGNAGEAYLMVKNAIGDRVYRFDDVPKSIIITELLESYGC